MNDEATDIELVSTSEPRDPRSWHALYDLKDVRDALSTDRDRDVDGWLDDDEQNDSGGLGTSRARLRKLLRAGEVGRWRSLVHPTPQTVTRVVALGARAPHLREMTSLVARRIQAALATGTPIRLPPTLLLGPPGVGKSWFMAGLAGLLGVPFRLYPMNLSTLSDGLSGSHPSWRSSAPGLVARTMLHEEVANPLVLIDEVDKPPPSYRDGDPYRPLYALLEPECARAFVDEHLGMPMDASAVNWVMSANTTGNLPAPILDRLVVVEVPEMSREDRMVVVASVYEDVNKRYGGFFDSEPQLDVLARLAAGSARRARLAVEDAMVRAAADGRTAIGPSDIAGAPEKAAGRPMH